MSDTLHYHSPTNLYSDHLALVWKNSWRCTFSTIPTSLGSMHLQQSEATETIDLILISKLHYNRRLLSAFPKLACNGSWETMSLKPTANVSCGPQRNVLGTLVYLWGFFVVFVFFLVSPSWDNLSPQALCSLCVYQQSTSRCPSREKWLIPDSQSLKQSCNL